MKFLPLTHSQSSSTLRELQNSSSLVYVNVSLWATCAWAGDIVFAKSSVPSPDQQSGNQTCSNQVQDLFICGIRTLGASVFKQLRVEKCLRELSRGHFKALVGGAPVGVKYQKTGKTSWTAYCSENL